MGSLEPAALADAGVGDFEEEFEDPDEVAEDGVDGVLADSSGLICTGDGPSAGLWPEMDEVAGGRTAVAFGAGSTVAVELVGALNMLGGLKAFFPVSEATPPLAAAALGPCLSPGAC
jgi:hypothetical protein